MKRNNCLQQMIRYNFWHVLCTHGQIWFRCDVKWELWLHVVCINEDNENELSWLCLIYRFENLTIQQMNKTWTNV